jgi:hypothetical protein
MRPGSPSARPPRFPLGIPLRNDGPAGDADLLEGDNTDHIPLGVQHAPVGGKVRQGLMPLRGPLAMVSVFSGVTARRARFGAGFGVGVSRFHWLCLLPIGHLCRGVKGVIIDLILDVVRPRGSGLRLLRDVRVGLQATVVITNWRD